MNFKTGSTVDGLPLLNVQQIQNIVSNFLELGVTIKGNTLITNTLSVLVNNNNQFSIYKDSSNPTILINTQQTNSISSNTVTVYGTVSISNNLTVSGTITGNLNGNQSTQSKLQTQRNIQLTGQVTGSQSFDGSSDITINTVVNHTHGTYNRSSSQLTGQNVFSDIVVSNGIVTGINTRQLTPQDIGQLSTLGGTINGELIINTNSQNQFVIRRDINTNTVIVNTQQTNSPDVYTVTINGSLNVTQTFVGNQVYGQVYNDYQEFRKQIENIEQGYVQITTNNGIKKCNKDKQKNVQGIVTDTYGFQIGKPLITNDLYLPIQVSGRVLQYFEGKKEQYKIGDLVVQSKNGKVRKLKFWEYLILPWIQNRIIGVVDEIPNYDTWGSNNIKVNNRIWIKVR